MNNLLASFVSAFRGTRSGSCRSLFSGCSSLLEFGTLGDSSRASSRGGCLHTRRLALEPLEERALLAGNVAAFFIGGLGGHMPAPTAGDHLENVLETLRNDPYEQFASMNGQVYWTYWNWVYSV